MKKLVILCLLSFFPFVTLQAQTSKGDDPLQSSQQMLEQYSKGLSSETSKNTQQMPQGNIVDPSVYNIGPGDVFSLTILPLVPYPINVIVSPSRSLVIPRFGEIHLGNKTIIEAQDTIQQFFNAKNKDIKISLLLQQPRMCLVTIRGNVLFPNVYSIPASFQVSSAINYANKMNSDNVPVEQYRAITQYNEQLREREKVFGESQYYPISTYYSRNVIVLHNEGTSKNVDIEKSKALNDPRFNPYVREGDEIIDPFEFNDYSTIQIAGEVNRPVTVPYKKGDKASLLLSLGYGLTHNADLDNIVLYSDNQKINIVADTNGNLQQSDFDIEPGSILVVGKKQINEQVKISTVSIKGQVKKPGVYVIENEKTRLRDLIDMAGGFTNNAHLPLATIYRFSKNAEYKMDVKKDFNESFQYSNLTLEDTTRFMIDMHYFKNYVSCDFEKLFNENENKYNVSLRSGDIIDVPEMPHQIYVYGQVTNPGYIEFETNKTMDYYITRAGGYADGAEKDRARIIRGRNLIWEKPGENVYVNAGDQIYIPRKQDIPAWLEIQKYSVYGALLGTAATIVNIIWSIYYTSKK